MSVEDFVRELEELGCRIQRLQERVDKFLKEHPADPVQHQVQEAKT